MINKNGRVELVKLIDVKNIKDPSDKPQQSHPDCALIWFDAHTAWSLQRLHKLLSRNVCHMNTFNMRGMSACLMPNNLYVVIKLDSNLICHITLKALRRIFYGPIPESWSHRGLLADSFRKLVYDLSLWNGRRLVQKWCPYRLSFKFDSKWNEVLPVTSFAIEPLNIISTVKPTLKSIFP